MPTPLISTTSFNGWYISQGGMETDLGSNNEIQEIWILEKKTEPASGLAGTAVYFVQDDLRKATVEGAIPYIGQRYVDWYPSSKLWMQYATLVSRSYENIENGRVRVQLRWAAPFHVSARWYPTNPSSTATVPIAYDLTVDYQTAYRATEMYRSGFGVNPPATSDTSAEIGGAATIAGMVGQPFNIEQLRIRIRRVVDFKYIPMSQLMQTFAGFQNSLNDTAFMAGTIVLDNPAGSGTISVVLPGFQRGSVLLEGMNLVKTEGQYGEMIFDFVHEDYYFFHEQIPGLDGDGKPKITQTAGGPELTEVKWKRVPRAYKEHNACFFDQSAYTGAGWAPVSNSGYLKLAQQGWWGNL